jgi:hypothetical protein
VVSTVIAHFAQVNNTRDFHHGGSSAIAAKANFEKVRTYSSICEHAEDDK